ncbi:interleukin-17 receptor E [Rhynchocyon petersi]
MGSPRLTALLLLPLLLPTVLAVMTARTGRPSLPHWSTHSVLASPVGPVLQVARVPGSSAYGLRHTQWAFVFSAKPWHVLGWRCPCCLCLQLVSDVSGLQWGWFHLLQQKSKNSYRLKFCRRYKMSTSTQRKRLGNCCLSERDHNSIRSPEILYKGLRAKRTQPSHPEAKEGLPSLGSWRHGRPEFSFDLLPEARVVQVTIPPGPEVSVRLCHQWALVCEELSSPFDTQKIVPGGHTVDLPYRFLLPCLCIEASYLQEDPVRHKKCPFQSWPEAYGSDFWKSVNLTDYSQHNQMVMALTLHCPLKLQASLCQRQDWHTLCEDLPNATIQESEGWYVLEKVDLHPKLCFKFSFANSSHVECPHGIAPSWNVSMDTQTQQLVLHFSSRTHGTFSAAWSRSDSGQDSLVPPVYSVSQTHGSCPVALDLVIPFLRPGGCVLVWRSDVQFGLKHFLCPTVSHRRLGLLILALLALTALVGIVLVLIHQHPMTGAVSAHPVLLLHAADSEAQQRLVGALAELLRAALGGGRDVIVDLWEAARVARIGPLPWLCAARARVVREEGTVLLLWIGGGRGLDPREASLRALLRVAPRPLLLLAYFSRLCIKGEIPPQLRALPRYRLFRDLPRLLRALDVGTSASTKSWGRLGNRRCLRSHLALCRRLEREAAKPASREAEQSPTGAWLENPK